MSGIFEKRNTNLQYNLKKNALFRNDIQNLIIEELSMKKAVPLMQYRFQFLIIFYLLNK